MGKFDDGYSLVRHQKTRTPTDASEDNYGRFMEAYRERAETSFSFHVNLGYQDQWVYTLFNEEEYEITMADLQSSVNEYLAYLFANQYV